jgi:signal transduction histidine kinase
MPQGGKLTVKAAVAGTRFPDGRSCLTVTVEDTGPGIPKPVQARVFEPFFSTKREGKGTGLGLSICQGIIRGHGGEIEVRSGPPDGTRFILTLPAKPGESEEVQDD